MSGAPEPILVRPAAAGDVDAVRACLLAAFEPYRAAYTPGAFLDTVPDPEAIARRLREMTLLVATSAVAAGAGRVVGTIGHQVLEAGVGHLRGMAVLPAFQGQGVAERLLAAAEADLAARGCRRVTLDTTRPLARAIRFYERLGYRPTGTVSDFHGMPLVEFDKRLAGGTA